MACKGTTSWSFIEGCHRSMTAFCSIYPHYCRMICIDPAAGNENFPRPFLGLDLDAVRPASAVSQVIGLVDRSYLTCASDPPSSALYMYAGKISYR